MFDLGSKTALVTGAAGEGIGQEIAEGKLDPAALPDALERAIHIVQKERRQLVLDVICAD